MKFIDKQKNDIITQLTVIANNINLTNESYLTSYPYFLDYFKNLTSIKRDNLIIGISFTYSWMPTILKSINLDRCDEIIMILNEVKNGQIISEQKLTALKIAFNNSLVGSSKLLHFINPKQYAIWDSRVFRSLYNEAPHKYKLERPDTYLTYLKLIEELKDQTTFQSFFELMTQKVGYEITEYRAVELALFRGQVEAKV